MGPNCTRTLAFTYSNCVSFFLNYFGLARMIGQGREMTDLRYDFLSIVGP